MSIIVENGAYSLLNMGDVAMLQVAVSRFKKLFPSTDILVFTHHPERLQKYCPEVLPLSVSGRDLWATISLSRKIENTALIGRGWKRIENRLKFDQPQLYFRLLKYKLRKFPEKVKAIDDFFCKIRDAKIVASTGGGYITDDFMGETSVKLDTLSLASKLGKKVVMLGQGIGPLENDSNYEKVKATMSSADFCCLRESIVGLPLLKKMGVDIEKIEITGDEAIELAYNARSGITGQAIGINLRIAKYSSIKQESIVGLRAVIHSFAKTKGAPLLPVPIDYTSHEGYMDSDVVAIQKILEGYNMSSDRKTPLEMPLQIINQVSHCRIVVTGSYHGAVFALSQGIPVIGLAKSQYYVDKFSGLSGQFPGGCKTLLLGSDGFEEELEFALEYVWDNADQLRDQLLKVAKKQIELGWSIYRKFAQTAETVK